MHKDLQRYSIKYVFPASGRAIYKDIQHIGINNIDGTRNWYKDKEEFK